jgi:transcription initiation factor TFIID TATA-box-binding protein
MVEVVNVVASGTMGQELDLSALASDLDATEVTYHPEQFNGLQVRYEKNGPVIILYMTGSYNIMGARSESEVNEAFEELANSFAEIGVKLDIEKCSPEISNIISKGYIDQTLDLETLVFVLGVNQTEYEPEQSPFIYYWPPGFGCLITIPANGEVIITGVDQIKDAEKAFEHLCEQIEQKME